MIEVRRIDEAYKKPNCSDKKALDIKSEAIGDGFLTGYCPNDECKCGLLLTLSEKNIMRVRQNGFYCSWCGQKVYWNKLETAVQEQ